MGCYTRSFCNLVCHFVVIRGRSVKRFTTGQYVFFYVACVAIIASLLTLLAAFITEVKGMVSYNYGATITIIVTIPAVAFALAYRNRD